MSDKYTPTDDQQKRIAFHRSVRENSDSLREQIAELFNRAENSTSGGRTRSISEAMRLIEQYGLEQRIDEVQNTVCKDNTFGYQEGDWEGISKQKRLKQLRGELERKKEEL